ncbi:hypothetical protein L7F22_056868 [Adiantum nelumboides]|nr:hypothetical protein [Adiantum nelumboides]
MQMLQVSDTQSIQSYRTVRMHVTESTRVHALQSREFCGNQLVTSKYNLFTFIPVNLFQQFSRAANLYFLMNAVVQLIPGLSPTGWATTVVPLSFVLLNAVKEAYDDFKRHRSDKEASYAPSSHPLEIDRDHISFSGATDISARCHLDLEIEENCVCIIDSSE